MSSQATPGPGWWYRSDSIVGVEGERLKLRVSAPPVDGDANRAVIELIAALVQLPRSRLSIARGTSGRNKDLRIADVAADADRYIARLQPP